MCQWNYGYQFMFYDSSPWKRVRVYRDPLWYWRASVNGKPLTMKWWQMPAQWEVERAMRKEMK